MPTHRASLVRIGSDKPRVAARKMKAPPIGLMIENRAGKASRKNVTIFQEDGIRLGGRLWALVLCGPEDSNLTHYRLIPAFGERGRSGPGVGWLDQAIIGTKAGPSRQPDSQGDVMVNRFHTCLNRRMRSVVFPLTVIAALPLSFACGPASAAFLHGEALDTMEDILTWIVLIFVPIAAIVLFWLVHILP